MAKKKIVGQDGQEYSVKVKKPIYKRAWFWILMLLLAVAVFGSLGGDDTPNSASTGTTGTTEAAAAEETEAVYSIGDTVEVGDIGIAVNSVEEQTELVSDNQFIENITTDGKLIVVDATITNNGNEAETFHSSMFKIIDDQERTFEPLTDASLFTILGDRNLFLESVNPGMSRSGLFVFEVPADVETYSLKMAGGLFSGDKVVVRLK